MSLDISFINDNAALNKQCEQWNSATVLALDTEFIRTDTFYPVPALLQIYDGKHCHLLDLTTLNDFSALSAILTNPLIVKVLHSCSEDLEIFENLLKTLPTPIFDTQIAAAFLGFGFSVGYSRLVKAILDIDPAKDESRSNWLQRPLSPAQVEYAALDVIYLYKVYLHLQQLLNNTDKKIWVEQSHQEMLENFHNNQNPEHYFHRFKSAWRLSADQQQMLFQLCLWREAEARRKNKPRNRVMRDEILFQHAQQQTLPKGYAALTQNEKLSCPEPEAPLPKTAGDIIKQLKQHIEKTAERLNIAPEVLGRKKDLTAFVNSGIHHGNFQLPEALAGWRKPLLEESFLSIVTHWKNP